MAQTEGFWGNTAGPGPSYFQAYTEYRIAEYGENSARVECQWWIYVLPGSDFHGAHLKTDWGTNVRIYGEGWYAGSGWRNRGWIDYGSSNYTYCEGWYTGGSGTTYDSYCTATYYPSAPTWTPFAVKNLTCKRESNAKNTITWSRNTTKARPYSGQYIWRSIDGGSWQKINTISGGASSYADTTTRPNHKYQYCVEPYNSAGNAPSAYSNVTINPPSPPNAPTSVTNVRSSDNKNIVTWNRNSTSDAPVDTFRIERSINGGGWNECAVVSGVNGRYEDNSTARNNFYKYRIRAENSAGHCMYVSSNTTYNTPCAPGHITGSRISETAVLLSIENKANTANSTEIQRSTDGHGWATIAIQDGKATEYSDDPGGGVFYYRARNSHDELYSDWSETSEPVVTICPPAAPTILKPSSSAVIPTTNDVVTVEWSHNTRDGSKQTAAQLMYTDNDGSTWTTVNLAGEQKYNIENFFEPNTTVTFKVRTKGVHEDYSPWSKNSNFVLRQPPSTAFNEPSAGFVIHNVPLNIDIQYEDISGHLVSSYFEIRDVDADQVVYSRDLGTTLQFVIPRDDFAPNNGCNYRLTAISRSDTGLQSVAKRDVTVEFTAPKNTSLQIKTNADTGAVHLRVVVNQKDPGVNVIGADVYRIVDGKVKLLAKDVNDGFTLIDKYAPVNKKYSYRLVAYAASGATNYTEHEGKISTPYCFFLWDENIARLAYNPSQSIKLQRPAKIQKFYANREVPVSYDSFNLMHKRTLSGLLDNDLEAEMFIKLMRDGGRCIYKSFEGSVYHADVEVSLDPALTIAAYYGSVSIEITEIDGRDL